MPVRLQQRVMVLGQGARAASAQSRSTENRGQCELRREPGSRNLCDRLPRYQIARDARRYPFGAVRLSATHRPRDELMRRCQRTMECVGAQNSLLLRARVRLRGSLPRSCWRRGAHVLVSSANTGYRGAGLVPGCPRVTPTIAPPERIIRARAACGAMRQNQSDMISLLPEPGTILLKSHTDGSR